MYYYFLLLIPIVLLIVLILIIKKKKTTNVLKSLDMVLFSVRVPEFEKEENKQREKKEVIGSMEQVFSSFLNSKERIVFEIASEEGGKDIEFYMAVPKRLKSSLEKYVQGVYPSAQVSKVPQDYTIFEPGGETVGAYLKLQENDFLPINTYTTLNEDPLSTLTNNYCANSTK